MSFKKRTKIIAPSFESSSPSAQQTVHNKKTFVTFNTEPTTSKILGGAATGTAGDENVMMLPDAGFEYHILGTQTILAPKMATGGLDVNMDQTANDGIEISQGRQTASKHAYTTGTDGPFFLRVKLSVADVSGADECAIGFRTAAAYQAAIDDYEDMAVLNVIAGAINIETIQDDNATTTTDTTDTVADGVTVELKVRVTAAGVVTYLIDGVAPTTTAAFTFDAATVVVPFFYFLNDADIAGATILQEWECGLE